MRNIFENRELSGIATELRGGVNLDEYGKFYSFSIYPNEGAELNFSADNEDWIIKILFPALENWLYYEEALPDDFGEDFNELSREEKVGLFEIISRAIALGWISNAG
jgi:hypothetical protein